MMQTSNSLWPPHCVVIICLIVEIAACALGVFEASVEFNNDCENKGTVIIYLSLLLLTPTIGLCLSYFPLTLEDCQQLCLLELFATFVMITRVVVHPCMDADIIWLVASHLVLMMPLVCACHGFFAILIRFKISCVLCINSLVIYELWSWAVCAEENVLPFGIYTLLSSFTGSSLLANAKFIIFLLVVQIMMHF